MQTTARLCVCAAALLGAFLWTGAVASSQTAVLQPVRDNTLIESASGALSNAKGTGIFAGKTNQPSGSSVRRGLLAFDIASTIPTGATIESVTLTLRMSRDQPAVFLVPVKLHRVSKNWGEGTSNGGDQGAGALATPGDPTWLHTFWDTAFWTTPGGDFVTTASATQDVAGVVGFYSWSSAQMVADVQAWLDNPASNFGWVVLGNETTPDSAKRFDSRENTTVANRPALTVVYSPAVIPTVSFTSASQTVSEGVGTATITAQLSAPVGQAVTVPFSVTGTATGGSDYSITASPLMIPEGSLSAPITVTLVADALSEAAETVVVTMGTPTNATLGTTTVHTLTISDAQTQGPRITSPTPNTALPATTVTFEWVAGGELVTEWSLQVGTSQGAFDLHDSGPLAGTSRTVSGLPLDGGSVFARLGYRVETVWNYKDFLYVAACCPQLTFSKQPLRGAHGFLLGVQPEVAVRAGGAIVSIDNSTVVTLTLSPNPAALTCVDEDENTAGVQKRVVSGTAAFAGCTIAINANGYVLQATAPAVTAGSSDSFDVHWAGDADANCHVDIVDFSILLATFGKASGITGFDARGDFEGDDKADIVDFSVLLKRFGKQGSGCPGGTGGRQ